MKARDGSRDVEIDGRITLKWILNRNDVRVWARLTRLRTESTGIQQEVMLGNIRGSY
jgi:hypothetical protein